MRRPRPEKMTKLRHRSHDNTGVPDEERRRYRPLCGMQPMDAEPCGGTFDRRGAAK